MLHLSILWSVTNALLRSLFGCPIIIMSPKISGHMNTQSDNNSGKALSSFGQSDSAFPTSEFVAAHAPSQIAEAHETSSTGQDLNDGLGVLVLDDELDDALEPHDLAAQRVVLPEGATKADVMMMLGKSIPNNEFGMPSFFYRSDMLPHNLGLLTQGELDACMVELDYSEGYPTFSGGHIFWQQLKHEPMTDFLLFQRYLEQAEELGLRQLQMLSMDQCVSLERVSALFAEFFWGARAKAFDYFQVAAESKRRILKARRVENEHFKLASGLLEAIKEKFTDPTWIAQLSSKEAIDVIQDLVKIQRLSLGLSLNGSANAVVQSSDGRSASSGAELLRDLTKGNVEGDGTGLSDELKTLLRDPNFTIEAQALLFRVRGSNGMDMGDGSVNSGQIAHMRQVTPTSTPPAVE